MNSPSTQPPSLGDIVRALRPNQWTKNAVVLAAFFFALGDPAQHLRVADGAARVALAAVLFCLVSSGVYIVNDIMDAPADRAHPRKRHRPIAAGRVPPGSAAGMALVLLAGGLATARCALPPAFALALTGYVGLQLLYTLALKRVALVDVFVIASGFVIRAIAGAVVLDVAISPWLLLCAFLLALFLALCKRRHEKLLANDAGHDSRASLEDYDGRLLDQLIAVVSAATVVGYAIYTLSNQTVEKFGTAKLGFTIPFVMFGIFRYLDLVYRHEQGDRPERILLTDAPILINLVLYGLCVLTIFLVGR